MQNVEKLLVDLRLTWGEAVEINKKELAVLDEQMIDIVSLVGKEISFEPIVLNYRVALARANSGVQ